MHTHDKQGGAFMIMKMKKSRRRFLKRLGAMAGAALVPGLATEDVLAIPITTSDDATKKKVAAKKKAAPKKKVAVKKKAAPKKKVAVKKKAAPKKKIVTYYDPPYTQPPVGVPEPSTFGLVSIGVAAIALATRHKKNGQEGKG
jgi:hypothetical protein